MNAEKIDEVNFKPKGEKYLLVKESLPINLHKEFDELLTDYSFYAFKNYGRKWVAYEVLADLVRNGWRRSL